MLAMSIFKKFKDDIDPVEPDNRAWEEHLRCNDKCSSWEARPDLLGRMGVQVVGEFKKLLDDFFHPGGNPLFDLKRIEEGLNFGPGSAPGMSDESFLGKIGHSTLTTPNPLVTELFYQWVADKDSRVECELSRILRFGPPVVVRGVKPSTVLKNQQVSRLVKPEPLLGMLYQKGQGKLLESRLRAFFGIDLSIQPSINKLMACEGSKGSRRFATADLTSASSLLSMGMAEEHLPRDAMDWLKNTRSTHFIDQAGEEVPLHMVATMGNGFCFPFQTAIFACAIWAVYRTLGIPTIPVTREIRRNHRCGGADMYPNFGCFGDDIIVEDRAFDLLVEFLSYLGSEVNAEKSFSKKHGWFRESCGGDFYAGSNVRGVYIKSLRTTQSRCAAINQLVRWSARTGILIPRCIKVLTDATDYLMVPPREDISAGVHVPYELASENIDVFEIEDDRDGDPNKVNIPDAVSYLGFQAKGKKLRVEGKRIPVAKRGCIAARGSKTFERKYGRNPVAKLIAASHGALKGGVVSFRAQGEPRYDIVRLVTPTWDYLPRLDPYGPSQGDWEVTAYLLLERAE
jgi:hypothetical protein